MRQIFALVLLGVVAFAKNDKKDKKEKEIDDESIDTLIDESGEFLKYAAKHNKFYGTAEEFAHREDCWKKSHAKVRELNKKNKNEPVEFADNFTSDMMPEEFANMLGLDNSDLVAGAT